MTDNDPDACQSKKSLTLQSEVALPKSRPPVEAWDEIRSSGLLDRVSHRGKRALYSDGARAWMTAGKHLGIKCYQVSHQRKEFCRSLSEVDPKLSKKAGTQVIDRKWKALKDFLPSNYTERSMAHMAAKSTLGWDSVSFSLLAQFAEMAEPSTILKTTGKVARKKLQRR